MTTIPFQPKRNNDEKKLLLFIIIFMAACFLMALISGCSPQKELARIEKSHPEYFKDRIITTVHHDTLITKEIHKDSVIKNIYSKDTVYIRDGKATVKYVYMTGTKGFIEATVKPDTVVKVDSVKSKETTIIREVKAPRTAIEWLQFWLFWVAAIYIVIRYGGPLLLELLRKIPNFPF